MKHHLPLLIVLLFLSFNLLAQQTINGTIQNSEGELLSGAHVLDINSRRAVATDMFGNFELTVADSGTVLRVSHIGYRPVLKTVSPFVEIAELKIQLSEESTLLNLVQVSAGEKSVINGKRGVVLRDFSFADGNLLLMAEDGIRYLVVCDEGWKELSRLRVDKKGYRLYDDCLGNAHLFGEDSVYQIVNNGGQIALSHAFGTSYFMEQMAHCSTSSKSHIFFSSYQKAGQEVYHYGLHRDTKKGTILQRVYDHEGLQHIKDYFASLPYQNRFNRRFRQTGLSFEEERLIAMREQLCCNNSSGVNRPACFDNVAYARYRNAMRGTRSQIGRSSIGLAKSNRWRTSDQYFQSVSISALEAQNTMINIWNPSPGDRGWLNLLSKPTYSPMFNLRDSIFVFDHVVGVCYVHDNEGNEVRSFPLEHQEQKGWRNLLVADESGEKVYAHVKLNNRVYLMEVDLNDGSLISSAHLKQARFVEHLKIKDGYAYYIKEFRDIYSSDAMMRQKL
jgi:hypothetical protein